MTLHSIFAAFDSEALHWIYTLLGALALLIVVVWLAEKRDRNR